VTERLHVIYELLGKPGIRKAAYTGATVGRLPAVLPLNAIAFRLMITICQYENVEGLAGIDSRESSDLFSQFLSNPASFDKFVVVMGRLTAPDRTSH
jgi:hypothetical protein